MQGYLKGPTLFMSEIMRIWKIGEKKIEIIKNKKITKKEKWTKKELLEKTNYSLDNNLDVSLKYNNGG